MQMTGRKKEKKRNTVHFGRDRFHPAHDGHGDSMAMMAKVRTEQKP